MSRIAGRSPGHVFVVGCLSSWLVLSLASLGQDQTRQTAESPKDGISLPPVPTLRDSEFGYNLEISSESGKTLLGTMSVFASLSKTLTDSRTVTVELRDLVSRPTGKPQQAYPVQPCTIVFAADAAMVTVPEYSRLSNEQRLFMDVITSCLLFRPKPQPKFVTNRDYPLCERSGNFPYRMLRFTAAPGKDLTCPFRVSGSSEIGSAKSEYAGSGQLDLQAGIAISFDGVSTSSIGDQQFVLRLKAHRSKVPKNDSK